MSSYQISVVDGLGMKQEIVDDVECLSHTLMGMLMDSESDWHDRVGAATIVTIVKVPPTNLN